MSRASPGRIRQSFIAIVTRDWRGELVFPHTTGGNECPCLSGSGSN